MRLGATGNTSYSAATSAFSSAPGSGVIYGQQYAQRFGQGTTIDYNAASDSYTFKRSDGVTVSVAPSDIIADGVFDGTGGIFGSTSGTAYQKKVGDATHTIALTGPGKYGDITMSHMAITLWNVNSGSAMTTRNDVQWQVWGNRTQTMPTSGTASYSLNGGIGANGFERSGFAGSAYDFLKGESTGNLNVNFSSGAIDLLMHLVGYDYVAAKTKDFGNFTGTGSVTSGSAYGGTFAKGGEFYGSFFGPQAQETAFAFFIDAPEIDVTGVALGFKK